MRRIIELLASENPGGSEPETAVDHQRHAGDERRAIGYEIQRGVGHLFNRRHPTERALDREGGARLLGREPFYALGPLDRTRRNAVDADAVGSPLARQDLR